MIVWKLMLDGQVGYVVPAGSSALIEAELSTCEVGQVLSIEVAEMSQEAFEQLEEFQGW